MRAPLTRENVKVHDYENKLHKDGILGEPSYTQEKENRYWSFWAKWNIVSHLEAIIESMCFLDFRMHRILKKRIIARDVNKWLKSFRVACFIIS